jgi:hypothetical protein
MVAAAAVTAGPFFEIFGRREAAEFEGFVDLLVDGLLDVMEMLLGVEEIAGDGIGQEGVAILLEAGDFLGVQRLGIPLFFLEGLAFGHELFILGLGFVVRQEGVNALPGRAQGRLVNERQAQFTGFKSDNGFSDFSGHKYPSSGRASCPDDARP